MRRLIDVLGSSILLLLAAPLLLTTALAIWLSDRGNVFYHQTRVGLHGRPFNLLKFRSMRVNNLPFDDVTEIRERHPLVTSVGKWIRRFRIDELPQLLNVLRNEMALVGPRPERPEFVATLSEQIPYYVYRHCVRPGITGWAQINYKYGDTLEDTISKLEYDLFYIKNMSLRLDSYIIFHTVKAMIVSRGAQ